MNNHTQAAAINKQEALQARARVHVLAKIAILGAIAYVLMLLEFSVPLMPAFLKFDFSDLAALLAGFSMGPLAAVTVELIKNLLHLPFTNTMMVGELANFIMGSFFVATASWIYRRNKNKRMAILGMLAGTMVLTLVGALFNHFINLPFYVKVMGFPMEAIFGACQAAGNTKVHDMFSLILWVFVPFNIVKGLLISLITTFIYKPLSPLLHH